LVHKNFPIRSHKYAIKAAAAALAADREGKFWEFHDELFKNYNRLNDQKIQEIAHRLELDETEIEKQRKDPAITTRIQKDYEEGIRLGIRGVPTVYVNGKRMRDRAMNSVEAAIEKELKAKQEKANQQTKE
jgi:protein-disulfide isomerase